MASAVSTLWVMVRCLSAHTPPYKTSDYSSLRKVMSNTRTVLTFGKCLQELLRSHVQMELSYTFFSLSRKSNFFMWAW